MFHQPSLTLGYNPVSSNIIIYKITLPLTLHSHVRNIFINFKKNPNKTDLCVLLNFSL